MSPLNRVGEPGLQTLPEFVERQHGRLIAGGCDLKELADRFGTPLYVVLEDAVRARCRSFREAFQEVLPGSQVSYAGKAFLVTAMAALVAQEGLGLDVVSGGELYTALAAGFPAEQIHLHGNNKSRLEVEQALRAGVGRIVLDNFYDIDLVEQVAADLSMEARVWLRVAPGIEAHTHEFIQTGKQDSKFGFDLASGQVHEAARRLRTTRRIRVLGLHAHIGSQITSLEPYRLEVERLVQLSAEVSALLDQPLTELNAGGGPGIIYTNETPFTPRAWAEALSEALHNACQRHALALPRLFVEPGRAIIGEAGLTLYRVGSRKEVPGLPSFVAVDGGMSDNIRPALYGAEYRALPVDRADAAPSEVVTLVGRFCESGDVLIRRLATPRLETGDVVAVLATGAYNYSMASNYNRVGRPAVVFVTQGQAYVVVAREEYADLTRLDRLPPHLSNHVPVQAAAASTDEER